VRLDRRDSVTGEIISGTCTDGALRKARNPRQWRTTREPPRPQRTELTYALSPAHTCPSARARARTYASASAVSALSATRKWFECTERCGRWWYPAGHARRAMAVLANYSPTRAHVLPPRVRNGLSGWRTEEGEGQCRQHNRRVSVQDLPRANIHANAGGRSRVLSRASGYRGSRDGANLSRAQGSWVGRARGHALRGGLLFYCRRRGSQRLNKRSAPPIATRRYKITSDSIISREPFVMPINRPLNRTHRYLWQKWHFTYSSPLSGSCIQRRLNADDLARGRWSGNNPRAFRRQMSLLHAHDPRRGVTPDRVMHRGTCLISHGSLAWDDGRWEGQGVWIGEYSSRVYTYIYTSSRTCN